jgi:hypothetical protein
MALTLREMQLLAEGSSSIENVRKDLSKIVDLFKNKPYYELSIQTAFVKERQLPLGIAEESNVFFVSEDTILAEIPEELQHDALGFCRNGHIVFEGRLVYPVMDVKGQVMGFCGWDKFAKPKYLDSRNSGYKAKEATFYGMEKLGEYYRSSKPIYVVEGIVCCLYLRSIGLQAVALLGSTMTGYVIEILKRVQDRVIFIPDNDIVGKSAEEISSAQPAGEHIVTIVKRKLPKARVVQSIIAKDVDDTRKFEEHKYEQAFIHDLIAVGECPYQLFSTIRVR